MVSFPQVSPAKPCTHLSRLPYVLHASLISFFLTSSLEYCLVSTDHDAPHYAVLSIPLIPCPFLTVTDSLADPTSPPVGDGRYTVLLSPTAVVITLRASETRNDVSQINNQYKQRD